MSDLLREVRRQLRPLGRQAEAARRHGDLTAELSALRIHLLGKRLAGLRRQLAERAADGAWAPSTQPMASTTLDLPEPLGPTTTVTPGSITRVVESAKDLNPFSCRLLRNTGA